MLQNSANARLTEAKDKRLLIIQIEVEVYQTTGYLFDSADADAGQNCYSYLDACFEFLQSIFWGGA
jgi:hypothetical protein